MTNEHCGDSERIVTLKNGGWRLGKLSGEVAASVPITRHRQFCELAILASTGRGTFCYAARVIDSDRWLHFQRLHAWMYPIVEALLGAQEECERLAEMVGRIHQLTQ